MESRYRDFDSAKHGAVASRDAVAEEGERSHRRSSVVLRIVISALIN